MTTTTPLIMATHAPKSILKPTLSQADRNRETALHHANLIQARKNIEAKILDTMEEMLELPLHPPRRQYTAASPSLADAEFFKKAMRIYQPSDYDDLIAERNIAGKCGFVLCPQPNRKETGMRSGQFRLVGKQGKAKDFRVVHKEELEKWCSDDCAKRALYVRVQLSARPAWERDAGNISITLFDEKRSAKERQEESLAEQLMSLKLNGEKELAIERGDGRGGSSREAIIGVEVLEKEFSGLAMAPSLEDSEDRQIYGQLEGYNPRFVYQSGGGLVSNEDEEMNTE